MGIMYRIIIINDVLGMRKEKKIKLYSIYFNSKSVICDVVAENVLNLGTINKNCCERIITLFAAKQCKPPNTHQYCLFVALN